MGTIGTPSLAVECHSPLLDLLYARDRFGLRLDGVPACRQPAALRCARQRARHRHR